MSSITGNGTGHIYYNINLTNNDTNGGQQPPAVSFTETRNTPYLQCPRDYYMSVVRFSLETPTLPTIIPQPRIGGVDENTLIYSTRVELTAGGGVSYVVTYTPQNENPPPKLPITQQDVQNPYYNTYSYMAFIMMVNDALQSAYVAVGGAAQPPYLQWDTGGNVAILIMDQNDVDVLGLKVYFNDSLFTLFSSFLSRTKTINGYYFHEIYSPPVPTAIISTVGGKTYYNVIQEYTTAPLWTPIDSIVFTTSMIPINPELVAAPVVYNTNQIFSVTGENANLTNVLTDFIVPLTTGGEYKPSINYTPTGEYRLVSMFGESPVNSIQVNVFYKNRFGTLVPLTLGFGCSASIKILFRRKDFGNVFLEDA